jgi:uncharacterized protein YpiB (UPF0302 family)
MIPKERTIMNTRISYETKSNFINWALKNVSFKTVGTTIILNHIKENKQIIKNIEFVDRNERYEKYLEITAEGYDGPTMYFSKGDDEFVTNNVPVIFDEIRKDHHKTLYININFKDKATNAEYAKVNKQNYKETESRKEEDGEEIALKRINVLQEIDKSLDNRNEERFYELVQELESLSNYI